MFVIRRAANASVPLQRAGLPRLSQQVPAMQRSFALIPGQNRTLNDVVRPTETDWRPSGGDWRAGSTGSVHDGANQPHYRDLASGQVCTAAARC